MLKVKDKLEAEFPWLAKLDPIAGKLIEDLYKKEEHYAGSWQKRGGQGAFMMLARKWDRIENISSKAGYDLFQAVAENNGDIKDDIDDLISYLMLVRAKCKVDEQKDLQPTPARVNVE